MIPLAPLTAALLGVLVLLGGAGIGWVLRSYTMRRRLETALKERERVETRIAHQKEELKATREEMDRIREGVEASEQELEKQKKQFDRKVSAARERRRSEEARLEAREARVEEKLSDARARVEVVESAAESFEAMSAEAYRRREEASTLHRKLQTLSRAIRRREKELAAREQEASELEARLEQEENRLAELTERQLQKLERISGLSREEGERELVAEMTREAKLKAAADVKEAREEARRTAQREAKKVVLEALQRIAASTAVENTVATVPLESEDMKGRVIGKEGRNIRAFEAATGVEVVVDDTPDAILVSGYEPVRREVARLSMERLLADGRIHPARIEEVVESTRDDIGEEIVEAGQEAALFLQLNGLHPELIRHVGRMKYRASYGQNLLAHSIEVAKLAGIMAAELGLDARKARRGGLLHDIGKVVEGDLESPHALVGMELAKRYDEHPDVCNAIGAHHDEITMTALISPVVQAADAVSGARPGARREAIEQYVERLKSLEDIAESYEGVEKAYAIQAGRELRVIVDVNKISDSISDSLAIEIAQHIENEMDYPGHIKVNVIREVRSVAFAR